MAFELNSRGWEVKFVLFDMCPNILPYLASVEFLKKLNHNYDIYLILYSNCIYCID